MKKMKIAFDIGGVISKYPGQMKTMMKALIAGGVEVFILTDMPQTTAIPMCRLNGIDFIADDHILSADWGLHQDSAKTVVMKERSIDILIDDRPDYVAEGDFIGMVLSPSTEFLLRRNLETSNRKINLMEP